MLFMSSMLSNLPKALAYLDPGSGSIAIQLIIAALLGLGMFMRSQWGRIRSLFGRKNVSGDEEEK